MEKKVSVSRFVHCISFCGIVIIYGFLNISRLQVHKAEAPEQLEPVEPPVAEAVPVEDAPERLDMNKAHWNFATGLEPLAIFHCQFGGYVPMSFGFVLCDNEITR